MDLNFTFLKFLEHSVLPDYKRFFIHLNWFHVKYGIYRFSYSAVTSCFLWIKVRVQQSLTSFVRGFSLHWRSYGGWGLASSWLQPLPFLLPFILRLSSLALSIKGTFIRVRYHEIHFFFYVISFCNFMLLYYSVKEFNFTDIEKDESTLSYQAISWLSLHRTMLQKFLKS